jgi:asparagine synthase (glutamine-hydrolysing)
MCGIAGIIESDPSRTPDADELRRMAQALRHRGPDGEGVYRAPGIGLAARRLAIVAPRSGDQPVANETGSVVLVCNGEIYNAAELRRILEARGHRFATESDVEVVVHLYEDHGPDCLSRLRGMFALALWDARRGTLLLARDRLGIKPLVWAETPRGLAFASEAKALFAAGLIEPRLDPAAIDSFFRIGFVISPRTAFEAVRSLPAGHRLVCRAGARRVEPWWDVHFTGGLDERPRRPARDWAVGLRERLEDAVQVHLRSDFRLSAWLSGGLDSSVVTALAARMTGEPLDVYTLVFDDPRYDEAGTGTLATHGDLPLRVHQVPIGDADFAVYPRALWHSEQPTVGAVEIPRWVLSRATSAGHRVALSGEGADEIFGGYWWYPTERWARPLARIPRTLRKAALGGPLARLGRTWLGGAVTAPAGPPLARFEALIGPRDREERAGLYTPSTRAAVEEAWSTGPPLGAALPPQVPASPLSQLQNVEMKTRLPDFIELKLDRISMGHAVEVRVPFLDHEVVEYAARIPDRFKVRRRQRKWILRAAVEDLIPDLVRLRPKRPLSAPYRRWFRQPLPEFAAELLSDRALRRSGYFDPLEVRRRLEAHRSGAVDSGQSLTGVLAIQVLDELFVRNGRPGDEPA